MDRKKSKGRQKISIERIPKQSDRFASFSKRRFGIYKKSSELSTLCDIDMGVILFSPTGKPYSFFSPNMDIVVNQLQNPAQMLDDSSRLSEAVARTKILQLNQSFDQLRDKVQMEKVREKEFAEEKEKNNGKGWWEGPIEEFTREQVNVLTSWLTNLKVQVKNREEELKAQEPVRACNNASLMMLAGNLFPGFDSFASDSANNAEANSGYLHNVYNPFK